MSTVLYPGSFDPLHFGHVDVVAQAAELFGNVVVAVMHNPDKPSGLLPTAERVRIARESLAHIPGVTVEAFAGLAVDAAKSVNALCIVKGLRTPGDFEIEQHYDDFDDTADNSYPQPAPVQARLGESEMILRRTIDIIATAPSVPLSSTPRIDRDEVIELLEDSLMRLPEEIRQARWMLKERQEFLEKTKREADEILGAARQQAERMVQRTEVVRAAETRARQVIDAADEESRRLKNETEDFLDQRLGSFEILLDRLSKTVANGRHRLSIGSQPPPEAEEPIEEQHRAGFFDQDIS